MEAIVKRALDKIVKDCPRRQSALKKQCRETLALIEGEEQERQEGEAPDTEANKYMPCLLAACASGVPRVVTTALDAIVKLIDYGYIQDVEIDSDDEESDGEVEQAGQEDGSKGQEQDDTQPEAQEAAATTTTADPPLDQPPCSSIHGDQDAEAEASSTPPEGVVPEEGTGDEGKPQEPVVEDGAAAALGGDAESTVEGGGKEATDEMGSQQQQQTQQPQQQQPPRFAPQRMFMDEVVERVCDCDLESEEVQLQVIKALVHACTATTLAVHQASLLTAVKTIYTVHLSTHDPINKNTAKASLQQMLSVVFSRMEAKDTQLKEEAAAAAELEALRQSDPVNYPRPPPPEPEPEPQPEPMPEAVFDIPAGMYPEVAEAMELPELYKTVPVLSSEELSARRKRYRRALRRYHRRQWEATTVQPFASVEHEDAFLLFRALCKLSQRPDHAGPGDGLAVAPTAEEARQMESKAVSLEMLLAIVENSGPGFRGSEKFVLAVRHYLCEALLLNSTSSNRAVMELSLKIFKPMCRDFKAHLKSQIEVFITTVFLRVLESENSTFEHKRQVLDVVTAFSDTPQALVEIFLTYDCDLHAIDLYNRIVNALSKISKGRGMSNADLNNNPGLLREESYLRKKGLEGLVNILQNMLRCVASDVSADLHEQGELLDGNRQISGDGTAVDNNGAESILNANGSLGDTLGSTAGSGVIVAGEQGDVDRKSPVSVVQEYDRKKKLAGDLGNGFVRFNLSPAKGITYLVEKGMLVYEPRAVATFLLENCDKLDKTQIGEYLGKEIQYKDGFCVQVLHEYVDMMDFKGMRFDDAIRHYLSGFRLPGEAQKIDRMMEKFSERYCLQNPSVFPSADTAFILAFSIIMLNTDLHNPAIKEERKMTREGFAANNRGIAAGGNLEESFLNEIFDHIRANPISLKEDDKAREKGETQGAAASAFPLYFTAGPSLRQKREAFNKEREDIIKDTEALFRLRKKQASAAKAQALARAAEEAAAAAAAAAAAGEPAGKVPEAVKAIEAKLTGAPPPNVAVALRADSASEGRRDVVRAMFEVAWWPMLGAFSQVLEDVDHIERADSMTEEQDAVERDMVALCVQGCRFGIRLGSLCSRWAGGEGEGSIARETFVNSLAKFTLLDTVKEMRPKSIDCVRALVDIALEDGNFLAESWGSVLRYISQLARLQLFASGLHTDDHFFTSEDGGMAIGAGSAHSVASRAGRRPSMDGGSGGMGGGGGAGGRKPPAKSGGMFTRVNPTEQARDVERMNAEAVSMAVDLFDIDRVFSSSPNLSTDAVKHFVTQLCAVSSQEVNHSAATFRSKDILGDMSQPRIFSLQKLVEVADFNMDSRGRIVWANVWGVLSEHFSKLGAHPNRYVAEYAVDSLKQLALKFVYKEELEGFNFQRLFLCPFESVFVATQHREIKVLVLDCVQNLVQARAKHIRSGWKSIFSVLALAAKDGSAGNAFPRQSWEVVRRLVDEEMGSLVYDFLDVVKCLVAFLEGADTDLALQSIDKLKLCAHHLASGDLHILPPALHGSISTGQSGAADEVAAAAESGKGQELVYLQLWWPLLFGLSEAMGDPRPAVRTSSLSALSGVLTEHGSIFSPQTWGLLFRGVVSPVFENAITDPTRPLSSEWPGQEEDPLEVASAAADRAEEAAVARAAARKAAEEERAAKKAAAGSGWSLLSRPFSALAGGGGSSTVSAAPPTPAPGGTPPAPPRAPRAPAAFEVGWTATMAEPLLDMCFEIFFKFEKMTLPLLPEVLALHQRCICQESEVLARIGLRSLGRFVTTMHKSFPDASDTICRPKATPGGQDGAAPAAAATAGSAEEEETNDKYTVWDTLTASLCAIVHDNLPLELLNQPFHAVPEVPPPPSPLEDPSEANARGNTAAGSSSSPAWMDTARPSSSEEGDSPRSTSSASDSASSAEEEPQTPPPANDNDNDNSPKEGSESSWGELQDASGEQAVAEPEREATTGAVGDGESEGNSAPAAEGDSGPAEREDGEQDEGEDSPAIAGVDYPSRVAEMAKARRGGDAGEAETKAGGGGMVVDDGDVVMVSPHNGAASSDSGSSSGYDGNGASAGSGGGGAITRRPNLGALMTMLVVSLRMQRLVHWVVRKRCLDGLSGENLVDLLSALEAASVVALRFNRHHNLRRALGRMGFMTRGQPVALCPMLEQEVAGYNLLLQTLVVLSRGMDVDSGEPVEGGAGWPFAQERLVQACKCVVLAYADREEHAKGLEMTLPGLDHSALVEEVKETTALVILALGSMMHISEEQVRLNVEWMYGGMTRLVRCNSEEVRHHVQQILIFKMGPAMVARPVEGGGDGDH